jgi:hypothetical protein
MTAGTISGLEITLDDVKPAVLRRIELPFDIRLDRLHLPIQAAMGGPTAISTGFVRAAPHTLSRCRRGRRLPRRAQGSARRRARGYRREVR